MARARTITLQEYRRRDAAGKIKIQPMRAKGVGGPVAVGRMAADLRMFEGKAK